MLFKNLVISLNIVSNGENVHVLDIRALNHGPQSELRTGGDREREEGGPPGGPDPNLHQTYLSVTKIIVKAR